MTSPCPPAVYPANAPIAELRTAEMFGVCAARLWVASYCGAPGQVPDWRVGFVAARVQDSPTAAFDVLFGIIAAGARRKLDIRCPSCRALGADEAALLQAISLLQGDRLADARLILADWLPPAAARGALVPAKAFADGLAEAGLRVPRRHCQAAQAPAVTTAASADHGLALLQ